MNASPQRKSAFATIQSAIRNTLSHSQNHTLNLVMDVATRWDSTCAMLIRALRLREAIGIYCQNDRNKAKHFVLSELEWDKIEYLVDLLRPFNFFTETVGKTKSVTIHNALRVYDALFERLVEYRRRLTLLQEDKLWVTSLIDGLDAAEVKLLKYYNRMYDDAGSLYGIATLLDPTKKGKYFHPDYY